MQIIRPISSAKFDFRRFLQNSPTAVRQAFRPLSNVLMTFGACLLCIGTASADGLVKVEDAKREYHGKIVSLTRDECSLLDRQGRLFRLPVDELTSVERLANQFEPLSNSALRAQLQQEFASGYEVAGSTHYFVCAPRGRASQYAKLFESIYRDVEHFYRVRGFKVTRPEFPMVAIVFRDQAEFARYCKKDQVPFSRSLLGYYSLISNRVALFDRPSLVQSNVPILSEATEHQPEFGEPHGGLSPETCALASGIAGETADTVIHETIHQVGYNIGIHSRVGGSPIWIVEGLATALEPSGMRNPSGHKRIADRINAGRSDWFHQRHRQRRPEGNLAALVADDNYFYRDLLNSYSESWAFTFFLLENGARRQQFVRYLKTVADRDPAKQYSAQARLADFESAFGDLRRLEVEFLRYMDRL